MAHPGFPSLGTLIPKEGVSTYYLAFFSLKDATIFSLYLWTIFKIKYIAGVFLMCTVMIFGDNAFRLQCRNLLVGRSGSEYQPPLVVLGIWNRCLRVRFPIWRFSHLAGRTQGSWWHLNSVADPGFPRGGGAKPGGWAPTYYLANFSRKLHENEEISGQRGGARPSSPPLDPPLKLMAEICYFVFLMDVLGSNEHTQC